jgi:hypothetical protein
MEFSAAIREEIGASAQDMGEDELRERLTVGGGALVVPREELRVRRRDIGEGRYRKESWKGRWTQGSTF